MIIKLKFIQVTHSLFLTQHQICWVRHFKIYIGLGKVYIVHVNNLKYYLLV